MNSFFSFGVAKSLQLVPYQTQINPLALELDIYRLEFTIYVKCEYFMNQEG